MRVESIIAVGMPGTGKSWALRALSAQHTRVMYVDPMGTATGVLGDDDNDDWTSITSSIDVASAVARRLPAYRLSLNCRRMYPDEIRAGVERLVVDCERATGNGIIIVDELGMIAPRREQMPNLERAMRTGRHKSVNLAVWVATQRAKDVTPLMRGLTDRFLVFRQTERLDLDELDKIQRGLGALVAELPDQMYYEVKRGKVAGPLGPVARPSRTLGRR